MTKSKTQAQTPAIDTVTAAFHAIASEFVSSVSRKTDGEWVARNEMLYTQTAVLKGFAWALEYQIERAVENMSTTAEQIRVLRGRREEAKGDIDHARDRLTRDLANRVNWFERLEMQVAALEGVLAKNIAVYEEASGEKYIARAVALADMQKAKAAKQTVSDDDVGRADRILKKLGLAA